MKWNLIFAAAAILISGCGTPPVAFETLPATDPASAGEVVVVRPNTFIGEDLTYVVNIDTKDIAEVGSREHLRFKLPAGEHRIAIRCYGAFTGWAETTLAHRVVAGQTAYLAVAPKHNCASIAQVPEREGMKMVSNTAATPRGWRDTR
jgi:hypothetical protein